MLPPLHLTVESRTRSAVRKSLDDLKPYLLSFIVQVRGPARIPEGSGKGVGGRSPRPTLVDVHKADTSALIGVILAEWPAFSDKLSITVRHYLHELRDVRNRWAHEYEFGEDEARRAADTAALVARAIGKPERPKESTGSPHPPGGSTSTKGTSISPGAFVRADEARRDPSGVILNANDLSAGVLIRERVLCPACEKKVFARWPDGWDAHSAHRCDPALGDTPEKRKAAFKHRFRHLFR